VGTPPRPSSAPATPSARRRSAGCRTAVGEGRIDLDEFGQRAAAAYAAGTTAQLDELHADLPAPASAVPADGEIVGERTTSAPVVSVFGHVKPAVTTAVPQRASTVFGDVKIDLARAAHLRGDRAPAAEHGVR
jgi:hypothetical protein